MQGEYCPKNGRHAAINGAAMPLPFSHACKNCGYPPAVDSGEAVNMIGLTTYHRICPSCNHCLTCNLPVKAAEAANA